MKKTELLCPPRPLPFAPRSERLQELFARWCQEPQYSRDDPTSPRLCRHCTHPARPVNSVRLCPACTKEIQRQDEADAPVRTTCRPAARAAKEPLWEILVAAAHGLPTRWNAAELTIAAWRLNPAAVCIAGHLEHPDTHAVYALLSAPTGPVARGLFERVELGVYRLTQKGRKVT